MIPDVVQFENDEVVHLDKLTNDQKMEIYVWKSVYLEPALRKLSGNMPNSPGDTLARIKMAASWDFCRNQIMRIDLFKKAQIILTENGFKPGNIDFNTYL